MGFGIRLGARYGRDEILIHPYETTRYILRYSFLDISPAFQASSRSRAPSNFDREVRRV
ncbi:hypothetical protein X777_11944 [Ooceraea biroi]|uniref:Uncharacterized protein n=1 Tax=Ooceraea biroi TaxID=2015173 RepID=A0A026W1I5_OOCBI|nr:hypothetical protein X777_11944 [Ooceraea biroi]